ncbi:MAG: hypothetical protein A2664_02465 [Candidatus Taylorbacteria bacterium RIFCSPHIGHO2_01_FULL_46_22b]|uniref:Uncharacterized protein n=1 Tax=Candidatus Taylorbacteria bacterium RIFCSPHIGHO2_01_FULL_46_22b TaxID=1802301 RepID=A0A1G2M5F8_9BACT|nr:MAG: hypothetical protein A2664_02465 [Candidatus Taylorbacteria bacterium RIFCSPHIGHO2_01_FULL_46_22b]
MHKKLCNKGGIHFRGATLLYLLKKQTSYRLMALFREDIGFPMITEDAGFSRLSVEICKNRPVSPEGRLAKAQPSAVQRTKAVDIAVFNTAQEYTRKIHSVKQPIGRLAKNGKIRYHIGLHGPHINSSRHSLSHRTIARD